MRFTSRTANNIVFRHRQSCWIYPGCRLRNNTSSFGVLNGKSNELRIIFVKDARAETQFWIPFSVIVNVLDKAYVNKFCNAVV